MAGWPRNGSENRGGEGMWFVAMRFSKSIGCSDAYLMEKGRCGEEERRREGDGQRRRGEEEERERGGEREKRRGREEEM